MAPAIFGPDEFRPALKSNQPEAVFSGAFHVTLDRALIRRAGNLSASFFASIFLRDKRRFFLAARCFEASAHGYLKIYYGKSSGNTVASLGPFTFTRKDGPAGQKAYNRI